MTVEETWRKIDFNIIIIRNGIKITRLFQNSGLARTKRKNKRGKICLRLNISRKQQWEILKFW